MPENKEDTVVTPGASEDFGIPQEDSQTPTPTTEETITPSETSEELIMGKPKSYWDKLEQENPRLKASQSALQKKWDRYVKTKESNPSSVPDFNGDEDALRTWVENPMTQQMLLKQAEVELKEGLDEIFPDYPDVPEAVKAAIRKNPRGFAGPEAIYVEDALIDIEDYLSSYSQPTGGTAPVVPEVPDKPKEFPVIGNNSASGATTNSKVTDLINLMKKGTNGISLAYQKLVDGEVDQKTFTEAEAEAKKLGIL